MLMFILDLKLGNASNTGVDWGFTIECLGEVHGQN